MKKVAICIVLLMSLPIQAKTFLIFGGKTGWIGQKIVALLEGEGHNAVPTQVRLEDGAAVGGELKRVMPDCVINAAGVTGTPNIDWCEDHKQETIRSNIIGALVLADVTFEHDVHMINLGTGCIYEYNDEHPMHSGKGYTEDDEPNFRGSFYSKTKSMLDPLLANYPNVLNLRVRMPISDDLHPRNFVTKITRYAKVIDVPNSMSVLHDLLALIPKMAERKLTGNYNFVNPGVISHNQVLDLYRKYIDPTFTYRNFTVEEQDKILKAGRSNNELDATKLLKEFPDIPPIYESVEACFKRMREGLRENK